MARSGRRPGDPNTREEILVAARAAFGELGFDRATIRGIAEAAGVDPALIHHYFGIKADLYAAAIDMPLAPSKLIPELLEGDPADLGFRITTMFFFVWENPESREPLLAMLRGAFGGNEQGTDGFRQFVLHGLLGRVVDVIGGPDVELRVELAMAQLVGTAVLRYVVRADPLAGAGVDRLIRELAPRVQSYLTPESVTIPTL
jgi:AcrR family transcriptional regulator